MDNYLEVLRNEFEAGEHSFIIELRPFCEWNKTSFSRLTSAMQTYCERMDDSEVCEKWIACGFWYIPQFVRDWTTHENFPRPHGEEYYEKAYERLDDLAYWFFFGERPCENGSGFEPL